MEGETTVISGERRTSRRPSDSTSIFTLYFPIYSLIRTL